METNNEILEKVLSLQEDNKITIMTIDGLYSMDISDFDKQPLEGKLYDLNRDRASLYTMANEGKNKRWINDLAMVYFIEYWNNLIEKQNKEIDSLNSKLDLANNEIEKLKQDIEGVTTKNECTTITSNNENNLTTSKQQSIFQPVMGTISI